MIKNIDKGNTLLIRGPARVTLLEGKLDVFGKIFLPKKEISSPDSSVIEDQNSFIIPSAQSYPLHVLLKSKLEIYTNYEENIIIIEENSI
ncbi:MAG: hypothetical protein ACXACB_02490, partial [Promethearchaeota archaeon]